MAGTEATPAARATVATGVLAALKGTLAPKTAGAMERGTAATPILEDVMLNVKVVTWSLASFSTVTYVICIVYGLIVPESLHMSAFLEQVFPGFEWLTALGFVVGLVEAFLYGAYAGLVFTPLYNTFYRMWHAG